MLRSDQFLKQRHRIQHIYAIRMLLPFQLTYVLSLILEELIHGILLDCFSNKSIEGMLTTRTLIPSLAKASCAATAKLTSEPVAN